MAEQKITPELEKRIAEHRSKTRQSKTCPWLIRDDGMIVPNVPLIAKKQNFRPYHGDPGATIEERMRYLQGFSHKRRAVVMSAPLVEDEPFDIAKATKEELIQFAMEEFSEPIDPEEHLNKVRTIVAKLAGVDLVAAQRPSGDGAPVQRRKGGAIAAGGLA
jgi:hypothetical protein